MKTAEDFLRIEEACRLIGVGRSKLYKLLGTGEVVGKKLGSITLITKQSAEAFLKNLPQMHAVKINGHAPEKEETKRSFEESHVPKGRLLGRRQLRKLVPTSEMTLWRWEREGIFPRHLKIKGRSFWLASEINEWVEKYSAKRDLNTNQEDSYDEEEERETMQQSSNVGKELSWEAGRRCGLLEALAISYRIMGHSSMPEVRRGARNVASEIEKTLVSEESGYDEPAIRRRKDKSVARFRTAVKPPRRRLSARSLRARRATPRLGSGHGDAQSSTPGRAEAGSG